ncbi:MAG: GtrA family protein [Steroidobacteraceae bacterium]
MRTLAREAAGYLGVSFIALGVDMGVLAVLVRIASLGYLPAACISFCVGLLVSYALSVLWVFKHRRLSRKPLEFASFAALGSLGLAVNAIVMSLAVRIGGLHYLVAKGVAAVCTFSCNFLARRQLLFVPRARATADG